MESMNKLPLTVPSHPLIRPDQLTRPAQELYAQLDTRAASRDVQAAVDADGSVAAEIMNAGLAIVGGDGYPAKREVSEHYVRAAGADTVRVVTRLVYEANPKAEGPLLAVFDGARVDMTQHEGKPMLAISGFISDDVPDYDEELFLLDLTDAAITNVFYLEQTWSGTLERMRAWPIGATPTEVDGQRGLAPFSPVHKVPVTVQILPMPVS